MALLGSLLWDSVVAAVLLFVICLWYTTQDFDYFKKRGIPYIKPLPFVGNFWSVVIGRENMMLAIQPIYEKLKHNRFGGIFIAGNPTILVCDLDMAKMVLTKDFSSVHDRGIPYDEKNDPLSAGLVSIPGARWKNLRSKLTPIFTSGKLKTMLPLMKQCSDNLSKFMMENVTCSDTVDMRDNCLRYATDAMGLCAFGIDCNSIINPKSELFSLSQKVFQPSILASTRFAVFVNSKILVKLMPFKWMIPGVHQFFKDMMKKTINFRETNSVLRNDFVNLVMQLVKADEGKTPESHPEEVIFNDKFIGAAAFNFFVGGTDSIASTIAFALYHLCLDTRIQEDLADEVISVLRNHDGQFTYEALKDMKLVDRVISETLRMYTVGGILFREVTSPKYILPGTDIAVEKGMKVLVAVQGFHYDPEIYPEPTKFDPDRFTDEEVAKRHPYAYMPFGEGPRFCFAKRFGLLGCKVCLATLIKDFKFSVSPKTQIPLVIEGRTFSPRPKDGLYLRFEARRS